MKVHRAKTLRLPGDTGSGIGISPICLGCSRHFKDGSIMISPPSYYHIWCRIKALFKKDRYDEDRI